MREFTPSQIRAAFFLETVKLHSWLNTYGLAVGRHQPNGHRRFSLADAATIALVVQLAGDRGWMQHKPAIALANALRPLLAEVIAQYEAHGADMFVRLDEDCPGAVCTSHNRGLTIGWDIHKFGARAEARATVAQAAGLGSVIIDFATLIKAAYIAVTRDGVVAIND